MDVRVTIRGVLEDDGGEVAEAGSRREALTLVSTRRPEVVLLDLNMPMMDGFDSLAELRRMSGYGDIPVVVLTARDLTNDDRRRLRGASQVLNKADVSLRALAGRLHGFASRIPDKE